MGAVVPSELRARRRARAGSARGVWRSTVVVGALTVILGAAVPAWAHGDAALVDEAMVLPPNGTVSFDAELHYHRVVGEVFADAPVRVRLASSRTGEEVVAIGPGTQLSFNELVRCCDEAWAPHVLAIENHGEEPVRVTARVRLVHDDLAVMVDGAEPGTRLSIVLLGLGWATLVWRSTRRRGVGTPLRRSAVGLAVLSAFVLGLGTYAAIRYGVGGAPSVVAGNADVPVLPINPVVSRASLLMGLAMIGWAVVGRWWVRAQHRSPRFAWIAVGVGLAGAVVVVAMSVSNAYGRPLVQAGWTAAAAGPVLAVLAASRRRSGGEPSGISERSGSAEEVARSR